jgi:RNA polymerase sigma factor (sigma-70 family)
MSEAKFSESLISLAREGDSQAFRLVSEPLQDYAQSLTRRFFAPGFEREDLYQEAMAGFVSALLSYSFDRGVSFLDFARLSMRNAVVNCVRRATRAKRRMAECAALEQLELVGDEEYRPDARLARQSEVWEMIESLRPMLSTLEWTVLGEVASGAEIEEVAWRHNLEKRAAENALSRARAKARRLRTAA